MEYVNLFSSLIEKCSSKRKPTAVFNIISAFFIDFLKTDNFYFEVKSKKFKADFGIRKEVIADKNNSFGLKHDSVESLLIIYCSPRENNIAEAGLLFRFAILLLINKIKDSELRASDFRFRQQILFSEHLNRISELVNRQIDFREELENILLTSASFMNSSKGLLFISPDSQLSLASYGLENSEIAEISKRITEHRNIEEFNPREIPVKFETILYRPIISDDKIYGYIIFYDKESRKGFAEFDDYDTRITETIANELGTALSKLTLYNREKYSREIIRNVLDSAAGGIIATDSELRILLRNEKALSLAGIKDDKDKKLTEQLPRLSPVRKFIEDSNGGEKPIVGGNLPLSARNPKTLNLRYNPLNYVTHSGIPQKGAVYTFEDVSEIKSLKENFSRYVSQEVFDKIISKQAKTRLGGERIECAIFFSDIRGFTRYSETLPPEEVVETLNQYFNLMLGCVNEYVGYIDKLVGDEIMAIYKEGEGVSNPTLNAVRTAFLMKEKLKMFNEMRHAEGKDPIYFGVGINYGSVVSGNIGSFQRMDYTIIGDNVNLAARLCGAAGKEQIIISENAAKKVNDLIKLIPLPSITVKGKEKPVKIFEASN